MRLQAVKRQIDLALTHIDTEIRDNAQGKSRFAGGLASEGYAGGYRDALHDVLLLAGGTIPDRRGYWRKPSGEPNAQR